MSFLSQLKAAQKAAQPIKANPNAPKQVIRRYVGVTDEQALEIGQSLVEDHGFEINVKAISKAGTKDGKNIVTMAVKSAKGSFIHWYTGKANANGAGFPEELVTDLMPA